MPYPVPRPPTSVPVRFVSTYRPSLPVLLVALVASLLAAPSGRALAAPPALSGEINRIISEGEIGSAFWGIYVRDLRTGEVLYRHNAERTLMPASTMKLFTAAAALDALGSDYRYRTVLYFDGEVEGTTLRGDLVIRGSGDPTLGSAEMPGENALQIWARRLAEMGVTRIEGRLLGDDDVFEDQPYGEGWDITYMTEQASRSLGVSAGGLSYGDNVVRLRVRSGEVGAPPVVEMDPDGFLDIRNRATTANRRRGWALDFQRNIGTETITVTGSLPRAYSGSVFMPVTNPTAFTVQAFKNQLQAAGITVDAPALDADEVTDRIDYDAYRPLFVHHSPPLQAILELMNKESNNFYAEQIFRTAAYGGTAEGGEDRVVDLLTRAGIETGGLSIRDGSGLSRKDLITPEAMGGMLAYMYDHSEGNAFRETLAEGGEPETTLKYRLRGVPVEAKTGSLEYVRALSGYTRTPAGHPVAFALMANNYGTPSYRIVQAFDRIVQAIAS